MHQNLEIAPRKSSPIPLSDTEFNTTPFITIPTFSPPPFQHILDPSDIDPTLLSNINKTITRKTILASTSIKTRPRHSQLALLFKLRIS